MAHSEWFELAKAEMLAANPLLREETIDLEGSTLNTIANTIAAAAEECEWQTARGLVALYLDSAQGDDLSRLVADRYAVVRKGTTAAVVNVVFSRTGTAAITIASGTVVATADGVRFATDEDIDWAMSDTDPKTVAATAVEVGPESNVEAAAITTIETALDDATVAVTNLEAAAGGNVDETDDELRERVRDVFARAVRGTAEAVRLGALTVERVREAALFESLDDEGLPSGGATLVIADAAGNANQELLDEVLDAVYLYRPVGVPVDVTGAVVRYETIVVASFWAPGQATAANVSALKAALVARVNKLDPRAAPDGDSADIACQLRQAILHEAAATVPGCKGVEVTTPAATVVPDFGEVIRTRLSDVTVN